MGVFQFVYVRRVREGLEKGHRKGGGEIRIGVRMGRDRCYE